MLYNCHGLLEVRERHDGGIVEGGDDLAKYEVDYLTAGSWDGISFPPALGGKAHAVLQKPTFILHLAHNVGPFG